MFMEFFSLTINLLILLCSTVNALVFSYPNQLAKLFKMEEEIILILRNETRLYNNKAIDLYLETCEPRVKQIPLGKPSHFEPCKTESSLKIPKFTILHITLGSTDHLCSQ